jgi:transposase-like protein
MFVAERFLAGLVKGHGRHPVSTDGGTWYPMACRFLRLKHHIHSSSEKSLIERTMQYIKDRTECFDDDYYFPCRLKNCKLKHVRNWLNLFVDYHNKELYSVNWTEPTISIFKMNFFYLSILSFKGIDLIFCN